MTTSQTTETLTEEQQLAIIHEEIDKARANAEPAVKLAEAVKRLLENEDFKAVVAKSYFEDEMKKLALTISMNSNEELVKRAVVHLKGIHSFREFLNTSLRNGIEATNYLAKSDAELIAYYQANFILGNDQEGNE